MWSNQLPYTLSTVSRLSLGLLLTFLCRYCIYFSSWCRLVWMKPSRQWSSSWWSPWSLSSIYIYLFLPVVGWAGWNLPDGDHHRGGLLGPRHRHHPHRRLHLEVVLVIFECMFGSPCPTAGPDSTGPVLGTGYWVLGTGTGTYFGESSFEKSFLNVRLCT